MKHLTAILLLWGQFCFGQTPTVKVFDAEDAKEVEIKKEVTLKNAAKWNWSLLARGTFMLNYEREIKPWISVEGGLGLCYRDFIFESTGPWVDELSYGDDSPTYKLMPGFEARVRLYPFKLDDMEGFYCSLGLSNRNYKYETVINDKTYSSDYQMLDKQFLIGWQYESYWFDNVLADMYLGVGLRDYSGNIYQYDESNNYTSTKKSESKPAIYFGYKLTIPF